MNRLRVFLLFLKRRPTFKLPTATDIVIFDDSLTELLLPFLDGRQFTVIERGTTPLHIPTLLKSLRYGVSMSNYYLSLVSALKPKLVLSLIDNDPALYRVKQFFPSARVVAIQNGWRGYAYEMFGQGYTAADRLACDEILVFGPAVGKEFERIISGKTVTIGSFKNNLVPIDHDSDSKTIALISTLRSKVDLDRPVQVAEGNRVVLYSEIFERRLRLAEYCHAFCQREGYHLRILGKDPEIGREFAMYAERLGQPGASWSFTPRSTLLANYTELDKARAVISSGSSLGYEALGRGCRVAFFMIDFEVLHEVGANFGWPLDLPDSGDFWSNRLDGPEVESILTHVVKSSDDVWRSSSEQIAHQLISYEEGNTTLRRIIDSI